MSDDLTQAELHLLKQISDSLTALNSRMEASEAISRQLLERMVRLEERASNASKIEEHITKVESNVTTRLNGHSDRIASLEATRHRLEGASGVADMLNKLWPVFAAIFGAVGVYVGFVKP